MSRNNIHRPRSKESLARGKFYNSRINLVIAVIFLLGGSVLARLFNIQVLKHDLYATLASGQHQIFNQLEPERGRIFIQDNSGDSDSGLYPIATNKNFALLYTVPKDVEKHEEIAQQLYEFFKRERIEEEVDDLLEKENEERLKLELAVVENLELSEKEARQAEIIKNHQLLLLDKTFQEIRNIKREAEINLRKEAAIGEYLKILKKENDPYEPLEQKVGEEDLKEFYAALSNLYDNPVNAEDLKIKNDSMLFFDDDKEKELELKGLGFAMKPYRFYPEGNIGANMMGFVGYVADEQNGRYGLEGFFDDELYGKIGSIKAERDARGDLIIIDNRQYNKPVDGSDLILTINRSIQFTACQKLNEAVLRHGADGGSVIVMEPKTGAILAMCSSPDYDPNNYQEEEDINVFNNPAIFSQYEPGSIFKAMTMAAALDQEKITPETTYDDEGQVMIEGWYKPIKNSDYDTNGGHGVVNMNTVLEESLNVGAIFVMRQIGSDVFADYVKKFGFGEKTGIELEGESKGDIRNLLAKTIKQIDAAVASFGQGISVTPLQMISAYNAIANNGVLMKPYIVQEIIHSDGNKEFTHPRQIGRVISEKAATILSGMLVNVVESGHAKMAGVDGYWIGGKTGTAQVASSQARGYSGKTAHTFVGFAPADDPKFVMLVKLDDPKDVIYSASSAAPLFGELAEFMLNYWQVPKERDY